MRWPIALAAATLCLGCRPDPGKAKYPDPGTRDPATTNDSFLPGEDPWSAGKQRLSLGLFYEGGFSDQIGVDDVTRHYFIWDGTYSQSDTDDRFEGLVADELSIGGIGWWGGGIAWDIPEDLSGWTGLHLAAKSTDPAVSFEVLVESPSLGVALPAEDYGFAPDGEWHAITLPAADFGGVDWTQITTPLALTGTGEAGDEILFDDVYYLVVTP